jgi:hypothetical protein
MKDFQIFRVNHGIDNITFVYIFILRCIFNASP